MRELTVRGRSFLAAGVAAVICGVQVGERDFVRIGLLAALLPLLARVLLRRADDRVWLRRQLGSEQVEAGETVEVQVTVGNPGRRTGALELVEDLPDQLGGDRAFQLGALPANGESSVRYQLHPLRRGRYPVGPAHLTTPDPLGMVDLEQVLPSAATLLVTPSTETLPAIALTGRWAGAGEDRTRDLIGAGTPDVTIREYRLGDDLRHIHWPSSARVDELMVRREEQQWQSRCTLLVDNRRTAHRGRGAHSSMETAVSVAASILRHLLAQDFEVRLVSTTRGVRGPGSHTASPATGAREELERLALMGLNRSEQLHTEWVDETQQGGMLVAVLGHLTRADTQVLSGLAAAGAAAYAVVLDTGQWEQRQHTGAAPVTPATSVLRAHGWKATTLGRHESLVPAWLDLAR